VGQDGITILLGLLLLGMTAAVPFWSQDIQPFCVIAQKRSEKYKKEEIRILVTKSTDNGASFFSPHSPSTLTSKDIGCLKSQTNSTRTAYCLFLQLGVHGQDVSRQVNNGLVRPLHVGRLGGLGVGPG
jgi:hypothetical protein